MAFLTEIKESLLHLVFPHICSGCGSDIISPDSSLCFHCIDSLPETGFHNHHNNPIEKIFWGRIPLISATAQYYFTKESMVQQLMHEFKYKGNRDLGFQLGRLMGQALLRSGRFTDIDILIPLPLFHKKEKQRGYNQAAVLCEGMESILKTPVLPNIITRPEHTETQTRKGRVERWKNIDGKFQLENEAIISGKHVLLVDDVITTGATLESCGSEILKHKSCSLSIASLCFSTY